MMVTVLKKVKTLSKDSDMWKTLLQNIHSLLYTARNVTGPAALRSSCLHFIAKQVLRELLKSSKSKVPIRSISINWLGVN